MSYEKNKNLYSSIVALPYREMLGTYQKIGGGIDESTDSR